MRGFHTDHFSYLATSHFPRMNQRGLWFILIRRQLFTVKCEKELKSKTRVRRAPKLQCQQLQQTTPREVAFRKLKSKVIKPLFSICSNNNSIDTHTDSFRCLFDIHQSSSYYCHHPSSVFSCQKRHLHFRPNIKILGIETSCDDTGAAVVNGSGKILGESIHRQTSVHLRTGGIIPNVAKEIHAEHIECVVNDALKNAELDLMDIDGIAVTVKPGLAMSLRVGLVHAQKLAHISRKPLIPIHHMEAHALTARMIHKIDFPFMVLLTSGGHCLLAIARDVDDFLLLGTTVDDAPGEAYDKTARELKLNTLHGLENTCGGAAVEMLAQKGNRHTYPTVHVMTNRANCNFSFTGLKIAARRQILEEYESQGLSEDCVLPNAPDICAWFQYNVAYHLARRVQRAFIFTELQDLIKESKTLVMSGGVASNQYIRDCMSQVCEMYGYHLVCPPTHLCTDNGIMIAWNGVEKVQSGKDLTCDPYALQIQARAAFGTDISSQVTNTSIKLPKLRFSETTNCIP